MSKSQKITLKCPFCSKKDEYLYWTSINPNINPELKELILNKNINIAKCTKCNKELVIASEILYHDMGNRIMLEYFPARDISERIERFMLIQKNMDTKILLKKQPDYKFRYVWQLDQLIEKIRIYDSDLDDKIIEIYKFYFSILQASQDKSIHSDTLYFEKIDIASDTMNFKYKNQNENIKISIPNSLYREVLNIIKDKKIVEESKWMIIDFEYGKKILLNN